YVIKVKSQVPVGESLHVLYGNLCKSPAQRYHYSPEHRYLAPDIRNFICSIGLLVKNNLFDVLYIPNNLFDDIEQIVCQNIDYAVEKMTRRVSHKFLAGFVALFALLKKVYDGPQVSLVHSYDVVVPDKGRKQIGSAS